jgi:DNA repair exonuclease SbcCD nuclease subunit
MDNLFHKVMIIADPHFGRSSNATQANQDNIDFLRWAIDEARTWGADQCIMLGDWFDNRTSVGVETMSYALRGLELLSAGFKRTWFISGNHDLYFKNRRDVSSIEFAKHIANITVLNDPTTIDGVTFLPWLVGDEHKRLYLSASRYVMGHLELPGFLLNARIIMPETAHTPDVKQFSGQEAVFTGHFHARQIQKNICYIGNVMPFNFTDEGDDDRGMMLLEWGHDPIFRVWPNQPTYRSVKLSDLLEDPNSILKQDMTLKVAVDVTLLFEEAQEMRETLVSTYGLRKVELNHARDEINQTSFEPDAALHTVDQLVVEGLRAIDSTGLSKDRLIEIYTSL